MREVACPRPYLGLIVQGFMLGLDSLDNPQQEASSTDIAHHVRHLDPDEVMHFDGSAIPQKRFSAFSDLVDVTHNLAVQGRLWRLAVTQYGNTLDAIRRRLAPHVATHDCVSEYWWHVDWWAENENHGAHAVASLMRRLAIEEETLGHPDRAANFSREIYPHEMASKTLLRVRRAEINRQCLRLDPQTHQAATLYQLPGPATSQK